MHTTRVKVNDYETVIFIHDGDYRGDVIVRRVHYTRPLDFETLQNGECIKEIVIPAEAMMSFAADAVRMHRISQIEQAPWRKVLFG